MEAEDYVWVTVTGDDPVSIQYFGAHARHMDEAMASGFEIIPTMWQRPKSS